MKIPSHKHDFKDIIHTAGEKATKSRIALLDALSHEKYPVSIKELGVKIATKSSKKPSPDQSTLYRTLKTLVSHGLVREINFDSTGARYELAVGRPHHHHIICTSCGFMEDIDICQKNAEKEVVKQAKKFNAITGHSLEFFGLCKNC